MEPQNIIEVSEEDFTSSLASPNLSDELRDHVSEKDFDRLRVKTKYFTKEYDKEFNLLGVEPFFVDVRLTNPGEGTDILESYKTNTGATVYILDKEGSVAPEYHIRLPEMRMTFEDLRNLHDVFQDYVETGRTSNEYLRRWYEDFGVLEHLLNDDKLLELNVNPPAYKTSIRVVHNKYQECRSNIYPSEQMLNALATRLKISTGRPLNAAQTQLDGEITIGNQRARVAAVIAPFSILGTGYSIRKHRPKPWTLQLFLENNTVNHWFAGLMSFMITHGRTFLTAGPRGSGKTSLLGSLVLEILPKYRIITIEDTQELPIRYYKKIGYDLLPLKVRSALIDEGLEMPFDKGLRTSLRLGDSALIIGEVRSKEAKVLYEAMRVGAMSNTVAGTIHADNPYGVFDRVVNDLDVPRGSFKATDLIVIQKQIKSATGLSRKRRVMTVAEVTKHWEHEPEFNELLSYDAQQDALIPTDELLHGKSITIQNIVKNSSGYNSYQDALQDIILRGWAKQTHVEISGENKDLLEANYVGMANTRYAELFEDYEPVKSDSNTEAFKDAYIQALQKILR